MINKIFLVFVFLLSSMHITYAQASKVYFYIKAGHSLTYNYNYKVDYYEKKDGVDIRPPIKNRNKSTRPRGYRRPIYADLFDVFSPSELKDGNTSYEIVVYGVSTITNQQGLANSEDKAPLSNPTIEKEELPSTANIILNNRGDCLRITAPKLTTRELDLSDTSNPVKLNLVFKEDETCYLEYLELDTPGINLDIDWDTVDLLSFQYISQYLFQIGEAEKNPDMKEEIMNYSHDPRVEMFDLF